MTDVDLPDWIVEDPGAISRVFSSASSNDIDLVIDNRLAQPRFSSTGPVQAYDLHQETLKLTRNPEASPRAERVAILFAESYDRTQGVFGVMFDRGFTTPDDPSESHRFSSKPREGCAVFLDTIRTYRPKKADFEKESKFTTVHEVAHLFNLQHQDNPPNYMARSPVSQPLKDADKFTESQQNDLANCSRLPRVWPGGEPFGGRSRGDNHSSVQRGAVSRQFGLELEVDIARREFWPFEPIELDIELRVAKGLKRSFAVENVIDPGYDAFTIWIEDPHGERRRYRPPRRYCSNLETISVKPNQPFRRDISIFAQAGGFTFSQPGIHVIWAELNRGAKGLLRSAKIEVNVLPPSRNPVYWDLQSALESPTRAKLLYHRIVRHGFDPNTLRDVCSSFNSWDGIAGVEYGLGRALLRPAKIGGEGVGARRAREGLELLRRARDRKDLGRQQRSWAEKLVSGARTS